ncbi:MAG: TlpA disulfide reductase family protein [Verrucomicrobiota bacterium]
MDFLKKQWGNLMLIGAVAAYIGLSLGTQSCPLCVAGDLIGLGAHSHEPNAASRPGATPAPNWQVATIDGQQLTGHDLKGRVSLIAYWATWCGPCKREIPSLVNLRNDFSQDNVEIIGISVDEPHTNLDGFVKRYGMNYIVARDNKSLYDAFGMVRSIPTIFIIDKEGRIQHRHVGRMPHDILHSQISELVASK